MNLTATLTDYNQFDIVSRIEQAFTEGFMLQINGEPVVGSYGSAPRIRAWQNGSISFDTPSKTSASRTRPVYVKVGQTITVAPR